LFNRKKSGKQEQKGDKNNNYRKIVHRNNLY